MKGRRKDKNEPLERAWSALVRIGEPIREDEIRGETTGAEDVETGMDAMATALAELKDLESAGGALDEVLAELGGDDDLVDAAAKLIELVGKVGYAGGLSYEEIERAQQLQEELSWELDELLNKLKAQQADD